MRKDLRKVKRLWHSVTNSNGIFKTLLIIERFFLNHCMQKQKYLLCIQWTLHGFRWQIHASSLFFHILFLIMPSVDDWWGGIYQLFRSSLIFHLMEIWNRSPNSWSYWESHYSKSSSSPEVSSEVLFLITLEWKQQQQWRTKAHHSHSSHLHGQKLKTKTSGWVSIVAFSVLFVPDSVINTELLLCWYLGRLWHVNYTQLVLRKCPKCAQKICPIHYNNTNSVHSWCCHILTLQSKKLQQK